jgi:hypothetical protein
MRKLVLTALLLVCVGAVAAAWLSSSTPAGSPIGDVNLAEERIPGSGTDRTGVTPRQASTSQVGSSLTAGGTSRSAATTPEFPIPDMTIASSNLQPGGYDARTATRRRYSSNNGSFGSRIRRSGSGSSGSAGFSSLGMGAGGVGGGGGGATVAPRNGNQASASTFQNQKAPAERGTPPAARPSPPRSPRSGGGSAGGPAPGGGSVGGGGGSAASPLPAAAVVPAGLGSGALAPIEGAPFSPGGSPSPAATPEPTTMLLLGTGIAGLYRLRRYLE